MTRWIVDASVAVKWFVPEPLSERAAGLLRAAQDGRVNLLAPDLIVAEFGSALVKKVAARELGASDAGNILGTFLALPVEIMASGPLARAALLIAAAAGCTFYDAVYLAAAQSAGGRLATADKELVRLVSRTPLADLVIPVRDLPSAP